jgi:hypothetical protein
MKKYIALLTTMVFLNSCEFYTHDTVHQALNLTLPACDRISDNDSEYGFNEVKTKGDYQAYLAATLRNLQKCPTSLLDQTELAAILAVYSHHFTEPLRSEMQQKSQEVFTKLLPELEAYDQNQDPNDIFTQQVAIYFKESYLYSFNQFKDLYELGLKIMNLEKPTNHWNFGGYFSQGIGAAHYAQECWLAGDRKPAHEWAAKSVTAWELCFKHAAYEKDYFRPYVEYALALGILGRQEEMMKALNTAAELIHTDLSYPEFQEVIDFVANMNQEYSNI